MIRWTPYKLLLVIVLTLIAATQAYGQSVFSGIGGSSFSCTPNGSSGRAILGREIGACMIQGMTSFYIKNKGDKSLTFAVRPESGGWRNLTLDSGKGDAVFCSNCSSDTFYIELKTGEKKVSYQLKAGQRYEIGWNAEKILWDVYLIASN